MIDIKSVVMEKAKEALQERMKSVAAELKEYVLNEFIVDLPQWSQDLYGEELQDIEPTIEFDGEMSGRVIFNLDHMPDKLKELFEYYMGNAKLRAVG